MFKQAIDSKYYASSPAYQQLGAKVNVLAFFQGHNVKIVGFSYEHNQYKVTSQNLNFQKEIGQYIWLCFAVTAKDKATDLESQFTLLFNPAIREWRLAETG